MTTSEIADTRPGSRSNTNKSARASIGWRLVAIGALTVFLVLAIGYSRSRAPWWDEGLFADIAITFAHHGHLGNSVLVPYGYREFPQLDRYTYWQFPLYLLSLGLWFRMLPETAACMRLFSVLWACVYLYSWFWFVRGLGEDEPLALFVTSVVAIDYAFLSAASNGRMDMMCSALGMAALAVFTCFKKRSWTLAVVAAASFGAASLFCHPMGVLMNVMLLAVIVLNSRVSDRRAILLAPIPYLLGFLLYGLYVAQAPSIFLAQIKSNATYRISAGVDLLHNLLHDFLSRYIGYYFTELVGPNRLKIASLLFALMGVAGLALTRELRARPLVKTLLLLSVLGYCGVALLDNQKIPAYFIYVVPFMTACGAAWAFHLWRASKVRRFAATVLVTLPVLAGVGGFLYKIHLDEYNKLYVPAIEAIRENVKPTRVVMGGAELGFGLGFTDRLIDDRTLGLATGVIPDAYVINPYYGLVGQAATFRDQTLQSSYHLIFANRMYQVYLRRGVETTGSSQR